MATGTPRTPTFKRLSQVQVESPGSEAPSFSGSSTPTSSCIISRCRDSDIDLLIVSRLERELNRENDEDVIYDFLAVIRAMHADGKRPTVRQLCEHMREHYGGDEDANQTGNRCGGHSDSGEDDTRADNDVVGGGAERGGSTSAAKSRFSTVDKASHLQSPTLSRKVMQSPPQSSSPSIRRQGSPPQGAGQEWKPKPLIAQLHLMRMSRQQLLPTADESSEGRSDTAAAPLASVRGSTLLAGLPLMSSLKLDSAMLSKVNAPSAPHTNLENDTWRSTDTSNTETDTFDTSAIMRTIRLPKTPGSSFPPPPKAPPAAAARTPSLAMKPLSFETNARVSMDDTDQNGRRVYTEGRADLLGARNPKMSVWEDLVQGFFKDLAHISHQDIGNDQDEDLDSVYMTTSPNPKPAKQLAAWATMRPSLPIELSKMPKEPPEWEFLTARMTAAGITHRRDGLKSHSLGECTCSPPA
eukprot:gene9080-16204_t